MSHQRVQDVRSEVKEGDQILVKVVNIDPSGKIRLSRKALIEGGPAEGEAPASGEPQPAGAYSDRGSHDRPHGGDRDRGRGGDRPRGGDRGGRGRGPR